MPDTEAPLHVAIHAPTPASLQRARNNARNILAARPGAQVRIVVNGEAVRACLEAPDDETDTLLLICENTLRNTGQAAPDNRQTTPSAALALAVMQQEGWSYIRA